MSVNVLYLSDEPVPAELTEAGKNVHIYHHVTSQEWYKMKQTLSQQLPEHTVESFMIKCGARPSFMTLSFFWNLYKCQGIVTVGDRVVWKNLVGIVTPTVSKVWLHYDSPSSVKDQAVCYCISSGSAVSKRWKDAKRVDNADLWAHDNPVLSFFTSTYKSGRTKLSRSLQAVMCQSYNNWEWVVVDDSGDDVEMQQLLEGVARYDMRIKHIDMGRSGLIGQAKARAAGLCTGEWLVELDHDDRLMPDFLSNVIAIGKSLPQVGVIFSDFCSIVVDSQENESRKFFECTTTFGFGGYMFQFLRGQWHASAQAHSMNKINVVDIVGIPNHVRSFRREVYAAVGGYDTTLSAADDYDLMTRLWLCGKPWVRIADTQYLQYDNPQGDNFTNIRYDTIRNYQKDISEQYKAARNEHWKSLVASKSIFPSTLQDPTYGADACYHHPAVSSIHPEYTWSKGKLHLPNCDYDTCQGAKSLLLAAKSAEVVPGEVEPNSSNQSPSSLIRSLLRSNDVTVLVLMPKNVRLQNVLEYLNALEGINETNPVYLVAHPDSLVRSLFTNDFLDADPTSTEAKASLLLRKFKTWCFGIGDKYYRRGYESWRSAENDRVVSVLANYGLKIVTRTKYCIYLDARKPVPATISAFKTKDEPDLPIASASSSMDHDAASSSTAETDYSAKPFLWTQLPYGEGTSKTLPSTLHGFCHQSVLPELYGYWSVDDVADPNLLVKKWSSAVRVAEAASSKE